jgi:hypothetical protein
MRLWPVRNQFVPLIGELSTFQQVLDRMTCDGLFAPPMIIGGRRGTTSIDRGA